MITLAIILTVLLTILLVAVVLLAVLYRKEMNYAVKIKRELAMARNDVRTQIFTAYKNGLRDGGVKK